PVPPLPRGGLLLVDSRLPTAKIPGAAQNTQYISAVWQEQPTRFLDTGFSHRATLQPRGQSMARPAGLKTGATLLLLVVVVLFVEALERRQAANLEGYVYSTCADNRLVGPVAGAIISTSVDGTIARTDADGRFQMLWPTEPC